MEQGEREEGVKIEESAHTNHPINREKNLSLSLPPSFVTLTHSHNSIVPAPIK